MSYRGAGCYATLQLKVVRKHPANVGRSRLDSQSTAPKDPASPRLASPRRGSQLQLGIG